MSARKTERSVTSRAWQRMLSGRRLDLLDPSPLDIEIADIAHGLARVPRWNGQTEGAHIYSVAQHCLLVETIARGGARLDRKRRLAIVLHDAPEYVIGDMISPFKAVIGDAYKAVEARLLAAIHVRFGLPAMLPVELVALIKRADQAAAYFEATRLAGFSTAEAAARHLLDQERVLRNREDAGAGGLAVPAGDAGKPMRDVLDLDVERRGVEQVEPPARQHALPGAALSFVQGGRCRLAWHAGR